MWWSELRAGWMAATSDPWRVFFSTSQTQEQWSANGLPVHLPSFSISMPATFHSCTVLYTQQYADSWMTAPPPLWELLNISSNSNLQSQSAYFLSRLRSAWGRAGGQGEGTASRGRAEGRYKLGKKQMQRKMKRRDVSECSQFFSCSISCIPSLPRLPGPPVTPAEVPFASPRAHSAGSAW